MKMIQFNILVYLKIQKRKLLEIYHGVKEVNLMYYNLTISLKIQMKNNNNNNNNLKIFGKTIKQK